jgi:hypothetical protein
MREPDFKGAFGTLWRVAKPDPAKLERPDHEASLGVWLLTVPSAHPMWHSYALAVISLRDIPGVPPASKQYSEATHELLLMALDPGVSLPDPDDALHFKLAYLTPPNLVEQFHGVTDEQAVQIGELLARSFIDGHANPDTDARSHTRRVLRNTVEHFALGGHPAGGVQ